MHAANAALKNQAAPRLSLPGGEITAATIVWLSVGLLLFGIALRLLVFGLDFPVWRDEASLSFNFLQWRLTFSRDEISAAKRQCANAKTREPPRSFEESFPSRKKAKRVRRTILCRIAHRLNHE